MVFETIYSLYEKEVVNEIKKLKTDEEIKFIERKGIIRDIVLKRLAKALSVAVYRNGKIEDVHAGECEGEDYFRGIPDSCMKAINIDVCNKIYTILKLLLATVYKGNIIKNLIMDCQSYTKYRPNETTGGIFVSWRRKEELPTGA